MKGSLQPLLYTVSHLETRVPNRVLKRTLPLQQSDDDNDDLLEVLSNYECRKRITAATLPQIFEEICHKELVQKPFVIDCWREITQPQMHLGNWPKSTVTSNQHSGSITLPYWWHWRKLRWPSTWKETSSLMRKNFLEILILRFFRCCTGSDLLVSGRIQVEWSLQFRPVSQEGQLDVHVGCSWNCLTAGIIFLTSAVSSVPFWRARCG